LDSPGTEREAPLVSSYGEVATELYVQASHYLLYESNGFLFPSEEHGADAVEIGSRFCQYFV
jgi:hypothetical protein